jgi:hypothetical protein
MRRNSYFLAACIIMMLSANVGVSAQSAAQNADLLYSVNNAAIKSAGAVCKAGNDKIAVLNQEKQTIDVYLQNTGSIEKTINLPCHAKDFDYSNGKYFVLDFNKISVIDSNGLSMQTLPYKIPQGEPFALEKFRVVNGRNIINTADEKAWQVTEKGLVLLDSSHWILENGFKVRTERLNDSGFNLSVIDNSGVAHTSAHSISEYGMPYCLAAVKAVAANENQVALDIEVAASNDTDLPKRYLVFTDLQGQMISRTEIPFVYAAAIQNRFLATENGVEYLLSAPDGLNCYKITPQKHTIQLPANCPSTYIYENLPEIGEPGMEETENDLFVLPAPQAGTNSITRTQVWENAYKFRDLQWTASSANSASCAYMQGGYVKTPAWINYSGGNTSVPYKWGGFTDWPEFAGLAAEGKKTGNIYCTDGSSTNNQCSGTPAHSSSSDSYVIGVDCSGFVSRCWELSSHTSTSGLPGISTSLGNATNSSNFSTLQVGDIINKSSGDLGRHVRLCLEQNPTGTASFMESSSDGWNVDNHSYSPSQLTNYVCYRYNNISDARLRLAQAITVSPANPVQGGTLTATYKIGNYGTESWTGNVQLWIIQSNGNEMCIQNNSAITISAGAASQTYTFTSPNVQSPAGATKLEVRVLNSSSGNYSRSYKAGGGGYNNPKTFQISGGGYGDGCTEGDLYPTVTFIPDCTGSDETIHTNCFAGEYSTVSVNSGTAYTFSSSVSSDFITITNYGGATVLATGIGSVSYPPASATVLRFYTHTNSNCGASTTARSRKVRCGSSTPADPVNDLCANAISLSCGTQANGTVDGATATASYSAQSSKKDVFYKFTADNNGDYTVTLSNFSGDKDLFLYSDCSSAAALESAESSNSTETVTHSCTAGATYRIRITDYDNTGGTFKIKVDCPATPQNGCTEGSQFPSSTFTPSCTGANEIIRDNCYAGEYSLVAVTGGIAYTFSSSISSDYITITNAAGTNILATGTGSITGTITSSTNIRFYTHTNSSCGTDNTNRSRMVRCGSSTPAAPANDLCANAISLSCGTTANGTVDGATPTAGYQQSNKNDVFYKFTAVNEGDYTVSLNNFPGDLDLFLYESCNTTNDLEASTTGNSTETVTYYCTSGTTYLIRITDYDGDGGTFTIKVTCPTAGDACEYNNTEANACNLAVNFSGNSTTVNTSGSDFHTSGDVDYYKIVLPSGYNYNITPRLHDSYASSNGQTYTVDAKFAYKSANDPWSDTYDSQAGLFTVFNGGTLYFKAEPYTTGNMGTYLLEINITRTAILSDDATLSDLSVNQGTLSPAFNPYTANYNVSVENSVSSITVSATASHPNATVSGTGSKSLNIGNNTCNIAVTAENGTAKIYTIVVNRAGISVYTITASASNGGSIAPGGTVFVNQGDNQSFIFTPDKAFGINSVLIDGEVNPAARTDGYYTFSNVSANHEILVTFTATSGTKDVTTSQTTVYPNPAKSEIFIKADLPVEKVEITDLSGRTLLSQTAPSVPINISALPQGVYLLKIKTDNGLITRKIIKE